MDAALTDDNTLSRVLERRARARIKRAWSSLPSPVIWKIKDKLDIFDNVRLAAVCCAWSSASKCYPPEKLQRVGDGLPWIIERSSSVSSVKEFISVIRSKRFYVDFPEETCQVFLLFSKQGWILFRRKNFSEPNRNEGRRWPNLPEQGRLPDSLFLINTFTKSIIKMPDVEQSRNEKFRSISEYVGAFSTVNGSPNCVVLVTNSGIRVAYPGGGGGGNTWTEYSISRQHWEVMHTPKEVLVVGDDVYCFGVCGGMITFNLSSCIWKEIPRPYYPVHLIPCDEAIPGMMVHSKVAPHCYVVEHEGRIFKLTQDGCCGDSFDFFRYDQVNLEWEKLLDMEDVMNTSWFIHTVRGGRSYCAKNDGGLKVYYIDMKLHSHFYVVMYDLISGTSCSFEHLYKLSSSATWVDIG